MRNFYQFFENRLYHNTKNLSETYRLTARPKRAVFFSPLQYLKELVSYLDVAKVCLFFKSAKEKRKKFDIFLNLFSSKQTNDFKPLKINHLQERKILSIFLPIFLALMYVRTLLLEKTFVRIPFAAF